MRNLKVIPIVPPGVWLLGGVRVSENSVSQDLEKGCGTTGGRSLVFRVRSTFCSRAVLIYLRAAPCRSRRAGCFGGIVGKASVYGCHLLSY